MEWDNTEESTLVDVANNAVQETEKLLQREIEQKRGIKKQELIDQAEQIMQNANAKFTFGDFFMDLLKTVGTGINWDDVIGDNRICMVNANLGANRFYENEFKHKSGWIGSVKEQSIAMNLQRKTLISEGKYRVSYKVILNTPPPTT